jgi:hypothetical protein
VVFKYAIPAPNAETYYLVKWDGWPVEYNQWVPEKDMTGAMEAARNYEKAAKRKAKKRNRDLSDAEEPPPKNKIR